MSEYPDHEDYFSLMDWVEGDFEMLEDNDISNIITNQYVVVIQSFKSVNQRVRTSKFLIDVKNISTMICF